MSPSASRERLAERDADVLDGVVVVDMPIALGADGHVDEGMARELIEHVVEKADAGRNVRLARTVEIDRDLDRGLVGLARNDAFAHDLPFEMAKIWAA